MNDQTRDEKPFGKKKAKRVGGSRGKDAAARRSRLGATMPHPRQINRTGEIVRLSGLLARRLAKRVPPATFSAITSRDSFSNRRAASHPRQPSGCGPGGFLWGNSRSWPVTPTQARRC